MEAEAPKKKRPTPRQYSEAERARLIREQAESGLTKKAFCEQRGINLGTFHGWKKNGRPGAVLPPFAQVEVPTSTAAAVEILMPNGVRVGVRQNGTSNELVRLVRGIAGAPEARHKC